MKKWLIGLLGVGAVGAGVVAIAKALKKDQPKAEETVETSEETSEDED